MWPLWPQNAGGLCQGDPSVFLHRREPSGWRWVLYIIRGDACRSSGERGSIRIASATGGGGRAQGDRGARCRSRRWSTTGRACTTASLLREQSSPTTVRSGGSGNRIVAAELERRWNER